MAGGSRIALRFSRAYPGRVGSPHDFDFWLGTWAAAWGDGETGRNVIEMTHGGKVVTESFDGRPGAEFTGTSWSVYDEHADLWRQTWVDDTGNYFALEGRFADDEMTLICDRHNSPERDVVYRMRFSEITDNAFVWRWERATEAGAVFELSWQIEYLRQA